MIFALGEDGVLEIFDDLRQVRVACEGIDVESGVWDFYGDSGEPLIPVFLTPNKTRSRLFGLLSTVVSSQNFDFKPAGDGSQPQLLQCLSPDTLLKANPRFSSVAEIRAYLEARLSTK